MRLAACLFLTLSTFKQENKIQRSDLPAAVEKTVAARSPDAIIHGFSEEKEHGQAFYEAKRVFNGHRKDILIDANTVVVDPRSRVWFLRRTRLSKSPAHLSQTPAERYAVSNAAICQVIFQVNAPITAYPAARNFA